MSKTPRTDANTKTVQHTSYYMGAALSAKIEVVDADFARRLETELNEALAMLKEIADGGRFTEAEVRELIKKVEGR